MLMMMNDDDDDDEDEDEDDEDDDGGVGGYSSRGFPISMLRLLISTVQVSWRSQ